MNEIASRLNRTPQEATAIVKFHASLNVSNLSRSVEFYTALFGLEPVKLYSDYAKFELNEPPFVLSLKPKRGAPSFPEVSERSNGTDGEEAASLLPPEGKIAIGMPSTSSLRESAVYWMGLPFRWAYQMAHNGVGILRVLDIIRMHIGHFSCVLKTAMLGFVHEPRVRRLS